jgi:hypothetical protein
VPNCRGHWNNRRLGANKLSFPHANDFSGNYPRFKNVSSKIFSRPVLGGKSLKNVGFKGAKLLTCPRRRHVSGQSCIKTAVFCKVTAPYNFEDGRRRYRGTHCLHFQTGDSIYTRPLETSRFCQKYPYPPRNTNLFSATKHVHYVGGWGRPLSCRLMFVKMLVQRDTPSQTLYLHCAR